MPYELSVVFEEDTEQESIASMIDKKKDSPLVAFFKLNQRDPDANQHRFDTVYKNYRFLKGPAKSIKRISQNSIFVE